jgi:transcriptional regulator with XRE-family HTH domain
MKQTGHVKGLGNRLRWLREKHGLTLEQFGQIIDFGRSYLSKLENGKADRVSSYFLNSTCWEFGVRKEWLQCGSGDPFVLDHLNEASKAGQLTAPAILESMEIRGNPAAAMYVAGAILRLNPRTEEIVKAMLTMIESSIYSDSMRMEIVRILLTEIHVRLTSEIKIPDGIIASALGEEAMNAVDLSDSEENPAFDGKKEALGQLTNITDFDKLMSVKAKLPTLIGRLNEATRKRGEKTALAKFMNVPLSNVSQWLSGEREPSGEKTLQLLNWVQERERQK